MRIFKLLLGIFLLICALGIAVKEFRPSEINHPNFWYQQAVDGLSFCLYLLCGILLVPKPTDAAAGIACASCGATGGHAMVPSLRDRHISRRAMHFGGVLLSGFIAGSRKRRFQCAQCNDYFVSPTALSKVFRLLSLIVVALALLHIYLEIFGG